MAPALIGMGQGNLAYVKNVGAGVPEYRSYFGREGDGRIGPLGGGSKTANIGISASREGLAGVQTTEATGDFGTMALTQDFKVTVQARIERDLNFREEILREGTECVLSGNVDTGKAVLRAYINATIGFQELGRLTHESPKSLKQMFGPTGNPQARNLFKVIDCLHKREGFQVKIDAIP